MMRKLNLHPNGAEIAFLKSCISSYLFQAYKALDQLRQIDPGERTESFILSYLEPDLNKIREGVKSPVSKH